MVHEESTTSRANGIPSGARRASGVLCAASGISRHGTWIGSPRLAGFLLGLCVLLLAGASWAATKMSYRASHVTRRTPDEVLRVLTAHSQHCDRGCKYYGPRVVQWLTLPYRRTPNDYFTWTYMSGRRDAEYFNHVRISRHSDGTIVMRQRLLDDRDEDTIDLLEEQTGLDHDPGFDAGEVTIEIRPQGDGTTRVSERVSLTTSGFLSLYEGTIRAGIEECVRASFRNIER